MLSRRSHETDVSWLVLSYMWRSELISKQVLACMMICLSIVVLWFIFIFTFDAIPPCLLQLIPWAFYMRATIHIPFYSSDKVYVFLSDMVSQFQFTSLKLSTPWCYFLTDLSGFIWQTYYLFCGMQNVFLVTDDWLALLSASGIQV